MTLLAAVPPACPLFGETRLSAWRTAHTSGWFAHQPADAATPLHALGGEQVQAPVVAAHHVAGRKLEFTLAQQLEAELAAHTVGAGVGDGRTGRRAVDILSALKD